MKPYALATYIMYHVCMDGMGWDGMGWWHCGHVQHAVSFLLSRVRDVRTTRTILRTQLSLKLCSRGGQSMKTFLPMVD